MHPVLRRLLGGCSAILGLAALPAQQPDHPPPWWARADNDTVSLYWSFDNAAAPLQPTLQVLPAWYSFPGGTTFGYQVSSNIAPIPALGGHVGALGFTGTGTGSIALTVDNDWRPNWIKTWYMQFDSFAAASGTVTAALRQDLSRYKRSNMTEKTISLGQGWSRTTITALLVPQPDSEACDMALAETALASVAIDNVFVNTHCVAPPPDATGDALGEVDTATSIDLLAATTNANCSSAIAIETPGGAIEYWVAGLARTAAAPHELYRLSATGALLQTVITPITITAAPLGFTDLTTAVLAAGTFVYGITDQRPGGPVQLFAFDAATGALQPAPLSFALQYPAAAPTPRGEVYYPHGNANAGSFLVSDAQGSLYEFDRAGAPVSAPRPIANGVQGLGYDEPTGNLYLFSDAALPLPAGVSQINGLEYSAYDFAPTGIRFLGDLQQPNPGGPAGGTAGGLHIYRRSSGEYRAVCTARLQQRSQLYELRGPFRFGYSLLGRCGMQNGPPFRGNNALQLTLDGVPHALFAALYFGFGNRQWNGVPLPFAFTSPPLPANLNLPETILSIALDANVGGSVVVGGSAAMTVRIPNVALFANLPTFWQWVVLDPSVPGGLTLSQAGKTVIY